MALKVQSSFAAGELDPALHERTNFDKYQSGLKTARNVVVGKSGRVVSRSGRTFFKKTKLSNSRSVIYSPPNSGYLIELGHQYVRIYNFAGTLLFDQFSLYTEADLPSVEFQANKNAVYMFCEGKQPTMIILNSGVATTGGTGLFAGVSAPIVSSKTIAGTGYAVEYIATFLTDGQESLLDFSSTPSNVQTGTLPIAASEQNTVRWKIPYPVTDIMIDWRGVTTVSPTEMRVYRRPTSGGAFGFIGSTIYKTVSGSDLIFSFVDNGQQADYTHTPPTYVQYPFDTAIISDVLPSSYLSKTGCFYQQRLVVSTIGDVEAILASRVSRLNNFSQDYPLGSDSALAFKSGSSGNAKILRMIDSDGLVAFTRIGIFLNTGALAPGNLSLARKGNWIIDDNVPPLAIPGGVLFIDSATNTVRHLLWSTEAATYTGVELSSYSNHLFLGRRVVSWGFEEGDLACLWLVMDDGTFVSFTYEQEQQMAAWTRHDSGVTVEHVAGTGVANKTFFLVEKDGERYIETTVPRYISGATLETDPEAYMGHSIAAMDSILSFRTKFNDSLVGADHFTIAPVTPDDWEGPLRITTGASNIFNSPGVGDVGSIYRFFDDDGSSIDLEVLTNTGPRDIIVQPSAEFPSAHALDARLYNTAVTFTGLTHLEGEDVAVMVDGYVVSSPNNDEENYPTLQVVGGSLTLPDGLRGAVVHIGRPITFDVETLDIDTVEQRPVLIESKTVNKLYLKTHRSRGLFVNNVFPADDKVAGMQNVEVYDIDYSEDEELIANRFQAPVTKRNELNIPGDWRSQGRVCLRQVDPLHFEILSIIPDLEDLRR